MSSYANFEAKEGTVNGSVDLTFNLKPRKVIITNDSGTTPLQFKFNSFEALGTLKPTETISLELASKTIFLVSTANVEYRIWGIG